MSGPKKERTRVLPTSPVPAAHRIGTAIIVLGAFMLLTVCWGSTPWYWHPHAPAIPGLRCGVVVCIGVMVLYWRFSLRLFVAAVLLLGACGALGNLSGDLPHKTFHIRSSNGYDSSYSGDISEDLRLLSEGLVGTLKDEGIIERRPGPIATFQTASCRTRPSIWWTKRPVAYAWRSTPSPKSWIAWTGASSS